MCQESSGTGVSMLREALIPLDCCLPRAQAAGGCSVFLSVVLFSFGHETQRKELDILMSFFHHPEMEHLLPKIQQHISFDEGIK